MGRVWVLERMVNGQRYSQTLTVSSERDAMAELALFNRDPDAYCADAQRDVVTVDARRVESFLRHLGGRGLAHTYIKDTRNYLSTWQRWLRGRDLRAVTTRELLRLLADVRNRRGPIVALKSFSKWLRTERAELEYATDPSLGLRVPKAVPEKSVRPKGYAMETVERIYSNINAWTNGTRTSDPQPIRDAVCLLAKTGMHLSEVDRLARGQGTIETTPGPIAAIVRVWHKNGRVHAQSVDAQTLAAALRLRSRGSAPTKSHLGKCLDLAARAIGLTAFNPGELRHSFATWATQTGTEVRVTNGGVSLATVAAVMGHDVKTNRDFYNAATPALIQLPLRLHHPDDPV
jgi:integrase